MERPTLCLSNFSFCIHERLPLFSQQMFDRTLVVLCLVHGVAFPPGPATGPRPAQFQRGSETQIINPGKRPDKDRMAQSCQLHLQKRISSASGAAPYIKPGNQ
jgi:hypothetical protein